MLLIHGLGDDSRVFTRMCRYLREAGREPHAISLRPRFATVSLEVLAEQIADYAAAHFAEKAPFDLIGFSMGGLVCRYYVQSLGGVERVRKLITISSPHRGTLTAYLLPNVGVRQMRPNSRFLRELNADMTWTRRIEWTSIRTPFDAMILPSRSSEMPEADNRKCRVFLHPMMLFDRRVLNLVVEILNRDSLTSTARS